MPKKRKLTSVKPGELPAKQQKGKGGFIGFIVRTPKGKRKGQPPRCPMCSASRNVTPSGQYDKMYGLGYCNEGGDC